MIVVPKGPELFSEVRSTEPGMAILGAVMDATDAVTAVSAFTFPYPQVVLGTGEPSVGGSAVLLNRSRICAPVRSGFDSHTSAAIPATCGEDMLVP